MVQSENSTNELLTPEEADQVERALLSSRDKFTARVAIYSLRILKQIAQDQNVAIASISPDQISSWVNHDPSVTQSQMEGMDNSDSFKQFFSRLVLSSLKPLHQVAQQAQVPLEQVTPAQIIQWFEREAKLKIEQGHSG